MPNNKVSPWKANLFKTLPQYTLQGGHAAAAAALVGPGGSDPNATCPDGLTLLELAAKLGQGAVITALIQGGADVDATDAKGSTALHKLVEHWKASLPGAPSLRCTSARHAVTTCVLHGQERAPQPRTLCATADQSVHVERGAALRAVRRLVERELVIKKHACALLSPRRTASCCPMESRTARRSNMQQLGRYVDKHPRAAPLHAPCASVQRQPGRRPVAPRASRQLGPPLGGCA